MRALGTLDGVMAVSGSYMVTSEAALRKAAGQYRRGCVDGFAAGSRSLVEAELTTGHAGQDVAPPASDICAFICRQRLPRGKADAPAKLHRLTPGR
jgi:hypothetical protein